MMNYRGAAHAGAARIEAVVQVDGLRVNRARQEVLHGLSFEIPRGQVVGLLGPSGCGKTTLLRALVGVQAISAGSATLLGRPAGDPRLRSRVAYVTQSASVYDDLTVEQNIGYFRSILGAPRSDVAGVLDATGLAGDARRMVGSLSGGQRSRVSLAAALLGSPKVLVLDEPTVGLDPVLRRDLWTLFARLAETGVTLLISSHVMDEATRCDRLLLLRDGMLLADDTPRGLLERTGAADADGAFLALVDSQSEDAQSEDARTQSAQSDKAPSAGVRP